MTRRFSSDAEMQICDLYGYGFNSVEISAMLGVSAAGANIVRRRNGISKHCMGSIGLPCEKCGTIKVAKKSGQRGSIAKIVGWCRNCSRRARIERRALNPETALREMESSRRANAKIKQLIKSNVLLSEQKKQSMVLINLLYKEGRNIERTCACGTLYCLPVRNGNNHCRKCREKIKRDKWMIVERSRAKAYGPGYWSAKAKRSPGYKDSRRQSKKLCRHARRIASLKRTHAPGRCSAGKMRLRAEYYNNRCAYCGGPYQEIDHVKPISAGGSNWPSNLVPVCRDCNQQKSAGHWAQWIRRMPL